MPDVPSTLLSTGEPIDICTGFALFPDIGTVRAGIRGATENVGLISVPLTQVLTFRFSVSSTAKFFIGVCGPAYAIRMATRGSYSDASAQVTIDGDASSAGLIYGINFGLNLLVRSEVAGLQWIEDGWNSRFESVWHAALNATLAFEVDAIALVSDLILGRLNQRSGNNVKYGIAKAAVQLGQAIGAFNIFGSTENALAAGRGQIRLVPEVDIPTNILAPLKLIPKIGVIIAAIEAAFFQISIGLIFSIGIPAQIDVTEFSVDDARYGPLTWSGTSASGPKLSGTAPARAGRVGVTLSHTIAQNFTQFTLRLAGYFNLTFLKVFSVGVTLPPIAVPDLLGYKISAGPFINRLTNTAGSSTVGREEVPYEVVFDVPGPAA